MTADELSKVSELARSMPVAWYDGETVDWRYVYNKMWQAATVGMNFAIFTEELIAPLAEGLKSGGYEILPRSGTLVEVRWY